MSPLEQAEAHYQAGRVEEALSACLEGLRQTPDKAELHELHGHVLQSLGRTGEAIEAYDRALKIDDRLGGAWYASGCAWTAQGVYSAALARLEKAAALAPNHPAVLHNLGIALYSLGLIDEGLAQFRRALELGADALPLAALATLIPGSPAAGHAEVLAARREWSDAILPTASVRPLRSGIDRPRIGYLSSFFASRHWMKPVWGLVNGHDREKVEIHLFSDAPQSKCADYRPGKGDRFHDISELSNRDAAALIEKEGVDILVDLNGYSRVPRLEILALRPAPIQVAWFNMYATSGMACFDYLIGDDEVIAPDEERFYTEKIVRVPGSYLTFDVRYPVPDVADPPSLKGGFTFGCLASLYKITPQVVQAWSRILARAPSSKLLIKNGGLGPAEDRAHLAERFRRCGVSNDRLMLEGPSEHFEYLGAYARVDVALDVYPYNGGTTTMESLWQGVPVLTFRGDRWAARQGASILRAAGLDDFVAKDEADYVERAVRLAADPSRLAGLRRGMRARLTASRACDTASFARAMEDLYRQFVVIRSTP